jgi:hypothetical protein
VEYAGINAFVIDLPCFSGIKGMYQLLTHLPYSML